MTGSDTVRDRLDRLRINMRKEGVYAFYIPSSDFHASEYTNDYFKAREFFTGFTGSAGELLVTEDAALLWTDGRYFIQAQKQLEGTGITLMRSGEKGVDTLEQYLEKSLPKDAVLGFDGRCVITSKAERLKRSVPSHKIKYKKDLTEGIFIRPAFPVSEVETLSDEVSGESSVDRMAKLREELKKKKCDAVFISDLEETAYLFNIRANDIKHTPVAMAYAYITTEKAYIFLKNEKADTGYPASIIKSYDETESFLKSKASGRVLIDPDSVNYRCYKLIKKKAAAVYGISPVQMMKAVKNQTEQSLLKKIYHSDSLQLTRFIKWIAETDTAETEMSAAQKLLELRKKIPCFNDLSFSTITAYGSNAAMIHYEPSKEHDRAIEKKGMLLVDSGGQYTGGTTDVTRTIVMGELSDEEKKAFTMTVCGMLRLRNAHFIQGTKGVNLDILAREKMWKQGIDYKHGTGHGVGYMLGVHEGPQAVRWRGRADDVELRPGMLVSDEPGIYKEGRFGVRCEDILLVEEDTETEDGIFYRFYDLTEVPIDDRGMDKEMMSSEELLMYEDYQRQVISALSDELDKEETDWLKAYCGL